MLWLWLGGLGLFATGIVGVWYSVTKTDYLPRLALWLMKEAYKVIKLRGSPEQEKAWRQAIRQGQEWDFARRRPRERR